MTTSLEQLCRECANDLMDGALYAVSTEVQAERIAECVHRAAPLLPEVIAAREALEEIRDTSKDVLFPAINKLLTEHGLTIKTDFVEQYRISNAHAKVDAALAGLRAMEGKG